MKLQRPGTINATFVFVIIFSILFINGSFAGTQKQQLIFLPIKAEAIENFEESIFQNVIKSELSCKFIMFSENEVKSGLLKSGAASCYTEKCLKKISKSLNCKLVALGRVTYDSTGYTIGIEIKNIDSNKELFSEMVVCSNNSNSKTSKKMQLSEAISKMKLLAKKVCDTPIDFSKNSKKKSKASTVSTKKTKPKLKRASVKKTDVKVKSPVSGEKQAKPDSDVNIVSLVIDYTPLEFSSEDMTFTFAGLKYSFFKPELGFISCELLTGKSSDAFYYGSTNIRQVDGGSAYKLSAGYDYPFFGGNGGIDIIAGGGLEYMDISLDIVNASAASVTKTCIYADTGVVYIANKCIAELKFRLMLGDDDPDYMYGVSLSTGMRF